MPKGSSINDVQRFYAIFDLPTYLVLPYNVRFLGLSWNPLPTLISDVINGRSLRGMIYENFHTFCNQSNYTGVAQEGIFSRAIHN
jgi:hypothetical protein